MGSQSDLPVSLARPTRVAAMSALTTEPTLWAMVEAMGVRKFVSMEEARRAMEAFVGEPRPVPDEPRAKARECLARAAAPGCDFMQRDPLVDEALALDPGNADAIRMKADRERDLVARLALLDQAIAAGRERAGGAEAGPEPSAHGWGDVRVRPWLRARGRRAETLIEAGRFDEAIVECEALLDLDEKDSMGMRTRLGTCYLAIGELAAFRRLRLRYDGDESGFMLWGEVLAALLARKEKAAESALEAARQAVEGVDRALLEPWNLPPPEDGYVLGEPSETAAVAYECYPAFCAVPDGRAWLRARTRKVRPRSPRVQWAIERIRPVGDTAPEPAWIEWLLRGGGVRLPESLVVAARLSGERGVAWAMSLLECEALDRQGTPGSGYGPASAAYLLGDLHPASAIEPMARALLRCDAKGPLCEAVTCSFGRFGAPALEPLLARLSEIPAGERHDRKRGMFTEALASLGTRDARVLGLIEIAFRREPVLGAIYYADHGDPAAVAFLSEWADSQPICSDGHPRFVNDGLIEVFAAIEALGGALTAAQTAKRKRIHELCRAYNPEALSSRQGRVYDDPANAFDLDEGFEGLDPLEGLDDSDAPLPFSPSSILRPGGPPSLPPEPPRRREVGRNDPCPCGSGRKYKRCCLDKDSAPE
jgi:hypothetical protein